MLHIQQKRKFKSIIYNKYFLAIFSVLVILSAHSTWKVYERKSDSNSVLEASLSRLNELQLREKELDQKINKLSTPTGIEAEIRSKFSVVKEGENMVVIVKDDNILSTSTDKKSAFWNWLSNIFN